MKALQLVGICCLLLLLTPAGRLSAAPATASSGSGVYTLNAEQWNVPRDAASILNMPALQAVMQEFQRKPGSRLLIKYPGGDEGTLWASELRGWFVALGVASARIELSPGSQKADQLEIHVIQPN